MAIFVTGNLWENPAEILLFTANSILDQHECLVMGRGSALEAKIRCPALPRQLGRTILQRRLIGGLYGLLLCKTNIRHNGAWRAQTVGAFQTKRHWRDEADLSVIAYSIGRLCGYLEALPGLRHTTVALPFPGIGAGQLAREQVLPLLAPLPATVTVYEYPVAVPEAVPGETP